MPGVVVVRTIGGITSSMGRPLLLLRRTRGTKSGRVFRHQWRFWNLFLSQKSVSRSQEFLCPA
jgi:hypothetical protein